MLDGWFDICYTVIGELELFFIPTVITNACISTNNRSNARAVYIIIELFITGLVNIHISPQVKYSNTTIVATTSALLEGYPFAQNKDTADGKYEEMLGTG